MIVHTEPSRVVTLKPLELTSLTCRGRSGRRPRWPSRCRSRRRSGSGGSGPGRRPRGRTRDGLAALGQLDLAGHRDRPRPAVIGLERDVRAADRRDRDVAEAACRRSRPRSRSPPTSKPGSSRSGRGPSSPTGPCPGRPARGRGRCRERRRDGTDRQRHGRAATTPTRSLRRPRSAAERHGSTGRLDCHGRARVG